MIAGLILLGILLAALAYWELIIAEGVHLGPRIVALLYDLTASRYDNIKQFNPPDESWFLGEPLAHALQNVPAPLVLDVATGTARLPRTLLAQPGFGGRVIALDGSRWMLGRAAKDAQEYMESSRLTLIWQDAGKLPFADGAFDAVTCLEALEFVPDMCQVLREIVRVLRPGGVVLVTNRVGPWAKFLPFHVQSPARFEAILAEAGLERIRTQVWQVEYDLVWANRPGDGPGGGVRPLPEILRCPRCNCPLSRGDSLFECGSCCRTYHLAPDGVLEML